MTLPPAVRLSLVSCLAASYGAATVAASTSGVPPYITALSLTVALVMPLAVGALAALAPSRRSPVTSVLLSWLALVVVAAVSFGAAWQPLAWFVVMMPLWLAMGTASALALSFIPAGRFRHGVAVGACLLPLITGPIEARYAPTEVPFAVTSVEQIAAPAREVWEQVIEVPLIGSDERPASRWTRLRLPAFESALLHEPRPGTVRTVTFSGGVQVRERVTEWYDEERLRVRVMHIAVDSLPRTASRWTAFVQYGAFTPFAASYDLEAVGDSAVRLRLSGEYRLATRLHAYLGWWAVRAVRHEQEALLRVMRLRAESAGKAAQPGLTAEMRYLRAHALDDLERTYGRSGSIEFATALFVNGERRVEMPSEMPALAPGESPGIGVALRDAIRLQASYARTSMWMSTGFGAPGDTVENAAGDSLRFEFEDWLGRCVREVSTIALDPRSELVFGVPFRSRCAVNVMAERIRRGRVLATLPISAGRLDDSWSVAAAVRGTVLVYLDSVVVRADSVGLRATMLEAGTQLVDSIVFGLSEGGERNWSVTRRGSALAVGRALAPKEDWGRTRIRFSIAVDPGFPLERSWPSFEVLMRVPRTADNPYGSAWTYAHAPVAFFSGVVRRLAP